MEENKINVNEEEISLIQSIFKNNEALLKAIRALFFGLKINSEEKEIIKSTFTNSKIKNIFWKRFYPTLDRNTPIGQVQDVWMGAEQMVFGQQENTIYQAVNYKDLSLAYTKQALELLDNPDGKPLDLNYDPKLNVNDKLGIRLLARNQFIRHVEQQLLFLKLISDQKETTLEELKNKLKKDSAK